MGERWVKKGGDRSAWPVTKPMLCAARLGHKALTARGSVAILMVAVNTTQPPSASRRRGQLNRI